MKKVKRILSIISIGLALLFLVGMVVLQQFALSGKESEIDSLKRGKDQTRKSLLKAANENEEIRQTLRKTENAFSNYKNTAKTLDAYVLANNVVDQENELDRWLGNIIQLRNFIKHHSEYAIPEFKYLTTKDWLAAVEGGQMVSEADYRKALALLRERAKRPVCVELCQGIQAFSKANDGNLPRGLEDIVSYLPKDFDPDILARYENNPHGQMDGVRVIGASTQWIIKEMPQVDDIWDSRFYLSTTGGIMVWGIDYSEEKIVQTAIKTYENQFGIEPTDTEQIIQYIDNKIGKDKINKIYKSLTSKSN
ncbi:hypothetical protein OH491_08340 [Termitidicoccus mucosus]|uniref:hypothetical protein n=1 Tax=Termitidicoccus mucosus TaxID=1184151 RepID=UPI003183D219